MKEKIKIGVLLEGRNLKLWEYRILEKLCNSEFSELVLLIEMNGNSEKSNSGNDSAMYRFHEKLDRWLYKGRFDYDKEIDLSNLVEGIPVIPNNLSEENSGENEARAPHSKIYDYDIDVILNFGFDLLNEDLLKVPRYGVWSYNVGDKRSIMGNPDVYWELVGKILEIGCTVSMTQNEDTNENIIYRSSVSTFSNSININRNRIYSLAELIIPRIIKGLFTEGVSYLDRLKNKNEYDLMIYSSKLYKSPSSVQAFMNLILIFTNSLYKKIVYLKNENWFLLFKINAKHSFPATLSTFDKLSAPRGKYWADPFAVSKDDQFYIFAEEYVFKTEKAHLSVLQLDTSGRLLNSKVIIKKPYHLSYPFVFISNEKYFMVPETKSERNIQLYVCTNFPDKWEFSMNLMENVAAVDSTLYFHENKWWLFTSIDEMEHPELTYNELFLFYSDDLFSGNWQSHPGNPIVTEISTSRCAGKIFNHNGKIFRPSQDCSGGYGRAFNLIQITKLTETEYEEKLITKVEPDFDSQLVGMHTFNLDKGIIVLDACSRRKRFNFNTTDSAFRLF